MRDGCGVTTVAASNIILSRRTAATETIYNSFCRAIAHISSALHNASFLLAEMDSFRVVFGHFVLRRCQILIVGQLRLKPTELDISRGNLV